MSEPNPEQTNDSAEPQSDVSGVEFFNQHEGTEGRQPGQYLDEIERKQAEVLRAESEGREPDLDHPPATAGTPLVTKDQLPDNAISTRQVYSEDDKGNVNVDSASNNVEPATTLPVDQFTPDVGPTFGGQEVSEQDIANAQLGNVAGDPVTGATPSNQTLSGSAHASAVDNPDYPSNPSVSGSAVPTTPVSTEVPSTEVPPTS